MRVYHTNHSRMHVSNMLDSTPRRSFKHYCSFHLWFLITLVVGGETGGRGLEEYGAGGVIGKGKKQKF